MARARVVPVLGVSNVEKSLAFYQALGFRPRAVLRGKDGTPERAAIELQGATFVLTPATVPRAPDRILLRVAVPEVTGLHAAAQRLGAVQADATDDAFRIEDLDGHVLEFVRERKRARPRPRRAVRKKKKRRR